MPEPGAQAYELDLRRYELRRGDGTPIKLERQRMELLVLLTEHQGQLVTREEIATKLWPDGIFVDTDRGINNAIRKIRIALQDSPDEPTQLQTVVGKGYRFIGHLAVLRDATGLAVDTTPAAPHPVTTPSQSEVSSRDHRILISAGIALTVVILAAGMAVWRSRVVASHGKIQSLAVLPLENLSGDPAQEYFADGMTDAIISNLAQSSTLHVISRTSAMQYKGSHKSLPEIARELNVDAVIEGSVVRSGNQVRIIAQLLDARSDRHLWAKAYDRDIREIMQLQQDVADSIVREIQAKLTPEETVRLSRKREVDPNAYEDYLRGLYFFDKRDAEASKKSVDYFRKAIAADPGFAPAYAGLAEALPTQNWMNGKPPVDVMPEAKAAAKHAIKLDDGLAEAHTALGALLSLYDWNWREAEKELKRALELNPSNPLAHERYMMWLLSTGRLSEAVVEAKRAQQLDPLSFFMNRELGHSLYVARRYDEALEQLHRAEELKPSREDWISWVLEQQGKKDEAIRLRLETLVGIAPEEVDSLRLAYTKGGWSGYWTKWIQVYSSSKREFATPYFIAIAEARLGHADEAWKWMEESADQREVWVAWIKVDPLFDHVRSHPGYKRLLQRINLTD